MLLAPLAVACEEGVDPQLYPESPDKVYHEMIQLGQQLEDPYNVTNVTKAVEALYPTKADRVDITPTNLYVRFLPDGEDQFDALEQLGVMMTDHPLDYEILREGDWYHDPELEDDRITWQYAVVDKDFVFPEGVRHEILHECYLSENDPVTRAATQSWLDWEEVERMAYVLTGNGDRLEPVTKASGNTPSGRITIEDPDTGAGQTGVAGVQVVCNSFVKFDTAYTDKDGNYKMKKTYKSDVRYRIVFRNEKSFSIGINLIFIPASVSTLGSGPSTGISVKVDEVSDEKLFRRCVVNNAVYDYIGKCGPSGMDLTVPPRDLRVWIFKGLTSSSTVMMHHGAFLQNALIKKYLGDYSPLLGIFLPDITIGTGKDWTYAQIYGSTVHEMAHTSHYSRVGNDYWNKYIEYIITSFVLEGGESYGSGTRENAGYCEVGEMWGYFMESYLYQQRYGGSMLPMGDTFWFFPQIHRALVERGITPGEILKAMGPPVTSRDDLKDQLISLYPEYEATIDQVFTRYSR